MCINLIAASVDDKDIFMCGRCKLEFYDFALFRRHKQTCSPSNHQNYPSLESDIQGYGTDKFADPLLGLAEAATFINEEESVMYVCNSASIIFMI